MLGYRYPPHLSQGIWLYQLVLGVGPIIGEGGAG